MGGEQGYPSSHGSASTLSGEVLQGSEGSSLALVAPPPQHQEEGLHQLHASHAINVGLPQTCHAAYQGGSSIPGILLYMYTHAGITHTADVSDTQ